MYEQTSFAGFGNATSLPAGDSGAWRLSGRDSGRLMASGREAARASPSVAPGPGRGRPTSGTCGRSSSGSSASAGQGLCLESKSRQPQLSERLGDALKARLARYGSMEYDQTWKPRVTPSGLRYWAHTASGRRTSGSGCTGSQTPTVQDACGRDRHNQKNGGVILSLLGESMLAGTPLHGYTTPRQSDPKTGHEYTENMTGKSLAMDANLAGHPTPNCPTGGANSNRENRGAGGADLEEVANLAGHPSPRAEDSEQTVAHRGQPDTLTSCERLAGHPTCTTRDHKDGSAGSCRNVPENGLLGRQCHGATTASTDTSTARTAGYRLNPGFSLWLMIGIPSIVAAWGSCASRATQSYRRSRRNS